MKPFEDSLLLLDKPLNWTSFDVVNKIRYTGKFKKVGHAGTLDPLATGLLILCTGKKTKEIESYQAQEKEYIGTFTLGRTTPSFDLETQVDAEYDMQHVDQQAIENARRSFLGVSLQTPPVFSAIKVNGKRAYEAARTGKNIELKKREIFIREFEITPSTFPIIQFRIVCSKGTYIRAIARDLGQKLNGGAHLSELKRTKIGNFDLKDALSVEKMVEIIKNANENFSSSK